jgi:acyl-CoA thioesterase
MSEREQAIREYVEQDAFGKYLGGTMEALEPGYCRVSLKVTRDMLNFHGTAHGAIIFMLGDWAFGAACNSRGQTAFALNLTMSFLAPAQLGDRLIGEARETQESGPTALYDLLVRRQPEGGDEVPIARAQALAYRKKEWFVAP